MEKLVDMLRIGGKTNSLGRANEVVSAVLGDKFLLGELYESLFDDDAWVRMRAVDCLEKVCRAHPEWVEPYVDRMLNDFTTTEQPSIQWHLAQMFAEVNLTDGQKKRAIIWLKGLLSAKDVDWIVSVNTMKTLVQFYRNGMVARAELTSLFELQQQHKSDTVRKKASQFLQNL